MNSFFTALAQRKMSPGGMWAHDRLVEWPQVCELAEREAARFSHLAGRRVLLRGASAADYATAFGTAALLGCEVWLQRPDLPVATDMASLSVHDGRFDVVDGAAPEPPGLLPGGIVVYTSGTTGPPRPRVWEFDKLAKMVRATSNEILPWLSGYPVSSFAGLYTMVSALIAAKSLFLVNEVTQIGERPDATGSLLCGTPTFWRRLLLLCGPQTLGALRPAIISLGGEIVSQDLLDRLARNFAGAHIVHVYAATEFGSLFSVSDRRSGFPRSLLGRSLGSGAVLEVDDGELVVRLANAKPIRTGDAVRIAGDRVLFDGRVDDIINVAGSKVRSQRIEEVIRELPFVIDVRVLPYPSPVTGHVVAAEIVVDSRYDQEGACASVRSHCATKLDRPSQPRRISVVDRLSTTATGKIVRALRT